MLKSVNYQIAYKNEHNSFSFKPLQSTTKHRHLLFKWTSNHSMKLIKAYKIQACIISWNDFHI